MLIPRGYKGIYTPKLPKYDLTTDAEYVELDNLVSVCMWLQTCNNAVYYIRNNIFLTDIIDYDGLKFS